MGSFNGNISSFFTDEAILRRYNDNEANILLPVIIFVSTLMAVGLFGNILVIYVYRFRFRKSSSRTFVLCLAFLDTAACVFGMPFHIADMLHPYMFNSSAACKSLSFIMSVVVLASNFVLVLIASDRYQKICKPFQRPISDFGTRKACVILIFLGAIFAIPHLILYGQRSVEIGINNITGTECFITDDYVNTLLPLIYNGILMLIFVSSTIVLSTLYSLVGLKVWKRRIMVSDKMGKDGNSSWKFCGNTSDTMEDEVFSENHSGNMEIKSVTFAKSAKGETTKIEYVAANTPIYKGEVQSDDTIAGGSRVNHAVSDRPKTPSESSDKQKHKKKKVRRMFSQSESDSDTGTRHDTGSTRRKHRFGSTNSRASYTPKRQKRAVRITIMLFAITLVYVISFLPFLVITVMDALDETFWTGMSQNQNAIYNFLLRTYFINNVVNPIIYGILDTKFRSETSYLFKRACGCRLTNE